MKKIRIAVGSISLILFCIVLFHAFSEGMFTFLNGDGYAWIAALILPAVLFVGGMLGILMRDNELGGVAAGVLFAVGSLSAVSISAVYPSMLILAACCLVFAAVMFVTSARMKMRRPMTTDELAVLKTGFRNSPVFPVIIALLVLLCACVLIYLSVHRSGQTAYAADAASGAEIEASAGMEYENTAASVAETAAAGEENAETVISDQLLYDENQVRITATGIEKNSGGYTVSLLIENNSILDLGFNAHAYAINGIMSRNNIYEMNCDVEAGKKSNVEMTIKASLLTEYGISEIRCLDVLFWAYDNASYTQAFTTGQLEIQTNLYNGRHDTIACRTFYDNNGISVGLVAAGTDFCEFCITNETGDYLDFDFADLAINGIVDSDIDSSLLEETLLCDCQILCTVSVSSDFLRNHAITQLDSVQWSMKLRPCEDAQSETLTGPILYVSGSSAQLSSGTVLQNPFVDVAEDSYYYDAVLWAVGKGISSGVSDTGFAPDAECTRAQMVSFLWRLAGSPKPSLNTSPFSDVQPGSSTRDAILWAWEQGIASGVTETTFMPDATITRAQAITMLWIYAGRPEAAVESVFSDVTDSTAYYYPAVRWGNEQGIVTGKTETEFAPGDPCSRAQVITFLYRYAGSTG